VWIHDVEAPFGAEVVGLDPSAALDDETRHRLRRAFDDRGLLLFRGLNASHEFQVWLSEMLIGNDSGLAQGRDDPPDDNFYISNRREGAAAPFGRLPFHSDAMWSDDPPRVLALYAVDVEPPVTPTMFASAVHGWETLPPDLRARVEGLTALHIAGLVVRGDNRDEVLIPTFERPPSRVTPIANRHPRTGQMLLNICEQMTREVVGLAPHESEQLLSELFAHLYDPANRWEHEWRNGDLAVWDNLAVHHARVNVPAEGPARTLRKYFSPIPSLGGDQRPTYSSAR
jgi:alpha-ketoglutarate-dependent taurine dioxygenase